MLKAKILFYLRSLGRKTYYLLAVVLVILLVLFLVVIPFIQNNIDARQERELFIKYSQDPQWKQIIDFMNLDKEDLANPDITKAKRVAATMDMGLQWFNFREFKFAAKWWEKGLRIEPNNTIGWYNLGNAYRELSAYSKAEKAYRRSMKMARVGEIDACLALGDMYKYRFINSRQKKEEKIYLECFEKHGNNPDILSHLAGYYRDIGDRQNALLYFDKLWSVDPTPELSDEIRALRVK